MTFRSFLYRLARFLGDIQAIKRGRIGRRIEKRMVGRIVGKTMGRLFR